MIAVLISVTVEGEMFDEVMVIPDDMDLSEELRVYKLWYREVYCKENGVRYAAFVDHLIEKGARMATKEEAIVFEH